VDAGDDPEAGAMAADTRNRFYFCVNQLLDDLDQEIDATGAEADLAGETTLPDRRAASAAASPATSRESAPTTEVDTVAPGDPDLHTEVIATDTPGETTGSTVGQGLLLVSTEGGSGRTAATRRTLRDEHLVISHKLKTKTFHDNLFIIK
jgi:hypothetical protein